MRYRTPVTPYSLERYIERHGDGSNLYRGADFAQPRTLLLSDVLSNGWRLSDDVREAGNGGVEVRFMGVGKRRIPARIPLQLQSDRPGVLPGQLQIGQILQTGCVILSTPRSVEPAKWQDNPEEVELHLTGGLEGHHVRVPADIELAVIDEMYPPDETTTLGGFAIARAAAMHPAARLMLETM